MGSSVNFNYADKRLSAEQYYLGFNIALNIKKGVAFNRWSEEDRKMLSLCCHSMIETHFLRFPHEEDHRVTRVLRHLFNIRNRRPPRFIKRIFDQISEEEYESMRQMVVPVSLALIRNTPVRPAHLPAIK